MLCRMDVTLLEWSTYIKVALLRWKNARECHSEPIASTSSLQHSLAFFPCSTAIFDISSSSLCYIHKCCLNMKIFLQLICISGIYKAYRNMQLLKLKLICDILWLKQSKYFNSIWWALWRIKKRVICKIIPWFQQKLYSKMCNFSMLWIIPLKIICISLEIFCWDCSAS